MTDEELLMEYLRTKDNGLFTMLYERMHDGLCAVARRIAPNDAEDVVQDAFGKLCELEPQEINVGFIVKMVQNLAIGPRRKRQKKEVSLDAMMRPNRNRRGGEFDEPIDAGDAPDIQLEKKESWEEVEAALDFLPPGQKEAIEAYFDRGQTIEGTAEIVGADPEAVKSRIQRGMEVLPQYIISVRHGEKPPKKEPPKKKEARPNRRLIRALDPATGVVVHEFPSISYARRVGYNSHDYLYHALRAGAVYKGLKWSYASAT